MRTRPGPLRRPGGYRLLEAGVMIAVLGAAAFGGVGLLLATIGAARPATVWPIAAVLWILLVAAWRPDRPSRPDLAGSVPIAALLVGTALIGVSGLTNVVHNGQYVRSDRDNGIYTSAAFWIAEHGDVLVDGRRGPHRQLDGITADSVGQARHDGDDVRLEIHGTHLFPSMLAQAKWAMGFDGVRIMPSLLGVLALAVFFLFALWWLPPWLAVAAVAALAGNFVFVYGVRSILTEPLSLAFGFAGLWMLLAASRSERCSAPRFALAGAVSALTLAVRVDAGAAFVLLLPAVVLLIVLRRGVPRGRRARDLLGFGIGAAPVLALAAFDLWGRSRGYATDLGSQIRLIRIGFVAAVGVAALIVVIADRSDRPMIAGARERFLEHRIVAARAVMSLLVAVFIGLWALRPLLGRVHRGGSDARLRGMANLQRREGFGGDGSRTFDEVSLERLGWYVGILAIALAIIGACILIERLMARGDGEAGLLLIGVLPMTLLYVWNPSIFPDQPWMMRRYLPVVIPGLLILAGIAFESLLSAARRRIPTEIAPFAPLGAGVVALAVFVLPPLRITAPLADVRWQAGGFHGIRMICDEVGDDAVVLFTTDEAMWRPFMTPIRSICDVPVLRSRGEDPTRAELAEIARVTRADDRRLWLLTASEEDLRALDPTVDDVRHVTVYDTTRLQSTLNLPPTELVPHRAEVFFAEVDP